MNNPQKETIILIKKQFDSAKTLFDEDGFTYEKIDGKYKVTCPDNSWTIHDGSMKYGYGSRIFKKNNKSEFVVQRIPHLFVVD